MTWLFLFNGEELTTEDKDIILFYDSPLVRAAHSSDNQNHYIIIDCNDNDENKYIIVAQTTKLSKINSFFKPHPNFKELLNELNLTLIIDKNMVEEYIPIDVEDIPDSWYPRL